MRLPKLCGCANPGRADHEKNLRENEIEEAKRLLERLAARLDVLLRAFELSRHNDPMSILLLVRLLLRRLHVTKFAMPNFAAGVRDVATDPECRGAQQNCGD